MSRARPVGAGRLRHRLALLVAERTPDGAGGHTESWSEAAQFFGQVEPLRAQRRIDGDSVLQETTHTITIRHRGGVEPGMRIQCGELVLAVLTAQDPDLTGRLLVVSARELGA